MVSIGDPKIHALFEDTNAHELYSLKKKGMREPKTL